MHELGLLRGVVEVVEDALDRRGDDPVVETVGLVVGTMSGVVPEALEGAWPIARAHTRCAAADLDIEVVLAAVYCPTCGEEQAIDDFFDLQCPVCRTPTADLRRGREFRVSYVDVGGESSAACH